MDWNILWSTFGLVFVAELGDKTQLAVLTQTCKFRRPWAVFAGASVALVGVTALGAVGGRALGQIVPERVVRYAAAAAFVIMGLLLIREAAKPPVCGQDTAGEVSCEPVRSASALNWKAFASTFGLLFVAEMGDKTQLAVLSLAGNETALWPVFTGGALALTAVTALGVAGGEGVRRLIPERVLRWVSAVAFIVMGILIGLGVF